MDYLWTPWRYHYLTTPQSENECVFCVAGRSSDDRAHLVVHRAVHNFVVLNRYPYTSGHVMILPYSHSASLLELDGETVSEMMQVAQTVEKQLRTLYQPDGLNIGMNIGKSAGAGIAGHLHMHAVPRWTGDSNFMTVIGETRVLPEDLETTWRRFTDAFRNV